MTFICANCKKKKQSRVGSWHWPTDIFRKVHKTPYEWVCKACWHIDCYNNYNCPMKFLPLSLKGKKLEEFISELKTKNISLVIDCRRKASRTAEWFRVGILLDDLPKNEIKYLVRYDFANNNFRKIKEEFMGDIVIDQQEIKKLTRDTTKIGLLCYCPEKEQQNNNCHVVWLAEKLNEVI